MDKFVFPGEEVMPLPDSGKVTVGLGVRVDEGNLTANKCGYVRQTRGGKIWINNTQRRYYPNIGDVVVGIIVERFVDSWTVDINSAFNATLGAWDFEGVTRRNRPNLYPGDLIFAKVVNAPAYASASITCLDEDGRGTGFGQLLGGASVPCNTGLCRRLLSEANPPILAAISAVAKFEIAIGMNGRFWVRSENPLKTILVSNAIGMSEYTAASHCEDLVRELWRTGHDEYD